MSLEMDLPCGCKIDHVNGIGKDGYYRIYSIHYTPDGAPCQKHRGKVRCQFWPCGCEAQVGFDAWFHHEKYCPTHDEIVKKIDKIDQEKELALKEVNQKYDSIRFNLEKDLMFSRRQVIRNYYGNRY